MNDNSPKDRVQRHALASTRLIEVFSGRSRCCRANRSAMEFVPRKGTTFYILGKAQGEPVGDDEFFQMVLKIWVGESPADHLLRRRCSARTRMRQRAARLESAPRAR